VEFLKPQENITQKQKAKHMNAKNIMATAAVLAVGLVTSVVVRSGEKPGETPPPKKGFCWLTLGGQIRDGDENTVYSYGGVVYPGCSATAAGGGNLNVDDHVTGLHFKGLDIINDGCSGVPTRSPRVTVNIIDFHGTGTVADDGGNKIPVTFAGRATDINEPGHDIDELALTVTDLDGNVLISFDEIVDTGNVQIHQSSCP